MNILYDSSEEYVDVTELFRFAQDFYLHNPGQQLDLAMWEKRVANISIPNDLWVVQVGEHCAETTRPTFIPVLAAITLGFSSKDLLAVMKHHDMDADDFLVCEFGKNLIPGVPHNPIDETRITLNSWTVCNAVLDAIVLDEALSDDLLLERNDRTNHYEHNCVLEVACLLSPMERLWPITKVKTLTQSEHLFVGSLTDFEYAGERFSQLSNDQILMILERSGNLHPFVISENGFGDGFTNTFFKDLFMSLGVRDDANLSRVIEALNSVEDPVQLSKLNARIISALPDIDFSVAADGIATLVMMEKLLDNTRYAPLLNNMVVKLNLLPIPDLIEARKGRDEPTEVQAYEEFERPGDKILKRLYDELLAIEPRDFRRPHFKAIGVAMKDFGKPQDLSGLNLQALLLAALEGFDAYTKAGHCTPMGLTSSTLVEKARPSVEALASFVSQHDEIDYGALSNLSSAMKALLAGCKGFDIRNLPGLSRHDKGQVLSDGLGL